MDGEKEAHKPQFSCGEDYFKSALDVLKRVNQILIMKSREDTGISYHGYKTIWFYQAFLFSLILEKCAGKTLWIPHSYPYLDRAACVVAALKSLLNLLIFRLRSNRLGFYSVGNFNVKGSCVDNRSCQLEAFLKEKGFNLFYFLRYFGLRDALKQFHRWDIFYPESFYFLIEGLPRKPHLSLSPGCVFTDGDLDALASYYPALCARRKYRMTFLLLVLRYLSITRFVMMDDDRYTNEMIVAAKLQEIQTIYYMHGRQNEYHVGLMAYGCTDQHNTAVNRYYVWSNFFRDLLLRNSAIYNEGNTFVSGHIRPPSIDFVRKPNRNSCPKKILFLCEQNVELEEIKPYLQALVGSGLSVVIRNRPGSELPDLLRMYPRDYPSQFNEDDEADIFKSLQNVDAVAGNHSTVLLEGWLTYTPAVKISTSYTYADSLVEYGVVLPCKQPGELLEALDRAFKMPLEERKRIKRYVWGDATQSDFAVFMH